MKLFPAGWKLKRMLIVVVLISLLGYLPLNPVQADGEDQKPLEGTIRDENGNPMEGITLSVVSPMILGYSGGYRELGSATTDENGRYSMEPFQRFFPDQGIGVFITFTIKGYPVIRSLGSRTNFDFKFPTQFEQVEGVLTIEGTDLPNPGLPVVVGMRMTKRDLFVLSTFVTDETGHYAMQYIPADFTTYYDGPVVLSEDTKDNRFYDHAVAFPAAPGTVYGYVRNTYGHTLGNVTMELDGMPYAFDYGGFAIHQDEFKNHHVKVAVNGYMPYENELAPGGPHEILLEFQPPTVTAVAERAPDHNGWYNHDVTVSFEAQPYTVVHVDPPQVVSTEGANQVITGSATDDFGRTAYGSITIHLDKTAPMIEMGTPVEEQYRDAGDLVPSYASGDATSGIDTTGSSATLDGQIIANGSAVPLYMLPLGSHTLKIKSVDLAGNEAIEECRFVTYTDPEALKLLVKRFAEEGRIKAQIAHALQKKLEKKQWNPFIHMVKAHRGKAIDNMAADILLRDAQVLRGNH